MVQIVNPGSPGAKNLPFALCNTTTGPRRGHWLADPSSRDAWALGVKRHLSNHGGPSPSKGSDREEAVSFVPFRMLLTEVRRSVEEGTKRGAEKQTALTA